MSSDYATEATKREYRRRARRNLEVPAPLRPYEYAIEVARTGDEVLESEGLTLRDVLIEPRHLLVGDAYRGGTSIAMDPFHPATTELTALRLADGTGDPSAIHETINHASKALRVHGIPDEVGAVHSIGGRADEFSAMDVLAVMPNLGSLTSWRERAYATYEMMGALVAVPHDNPARVATLEYVSALANPGVSLALVDPYVNRVLHALSAWSAGHEKSGWGIHE